MPDQARPAQGVHGRMARSRHTTYYEVLERLEQPGCPVCTLAERSVHHYLESLSYEQVNDPGIRASLRKAGGFCRRHAWQFLRMGGAVLGAAIIYADILRTVKRELPSWAEGSSRSSDATGLLGSLFGATPAPRRTRPARCPACSAEAESEARYLEVIVDHISEPVFRERYERADGLCLPHLREALSRADSATAAVLRVSTELKLDALLRDLDEFIRKHDYRFRHEGWKGREAESPARAVRLVAGEPLGGKLDSRSATTPVPGNRVDS